MDLLSMVHNAYFCLRDKTQEEYENQVARLLDDGLYGIQRWCDTMAYQRGTSDDGRAFRFLQNALVYFIYIDGTLCQGEYDVYCKWCRKAGKTPLSTTQTKSLRMSMTGEKGVDTLVYLYNLRDHMDSAMYHNMVYGIVMMLLLNSRRISQIAYQAICVLFDKDRDNYPKTYSDFLDELAY